MKAISLTLVLGLGLGLGLASSVQAEQFKVCHQELDGTACQYYLEGIVDGVLMHQYKGPGARIDSDTYQSRALKFRAGKRFQEANRTYCKDRLPDRAVLVQGLSEAFKAGDIQDLPMLNEMMYSLMDCQRPS